MSAVALFVIAFVLFVLMGAVSRIATALEAIASFYKDYQGGDE